MGIVDIRKVCKNAAFNLDPEGQEYHDARFVFGLTGKFPIWKGVTLAYDVRPKNWYVDKIHETQSYRWRWVFGPVAVMAG